jgi:hypothetical protein
MNVYFTTAPAAYDYDTVKETLEEFELPRYGSPYGRVDTWRKVLVSEDAWRVEYQLARYRSGLHAAQQVDPREQQREWREIAAKEAAERAKWDAWLAAAPTVAVLNTRQYDIPFGQKSAWEARRAELSLKEEQAAQEQARQEALTTFRTWVEEHGGDPSEPVLISLRGTKDAMRQVAVFRAGVVPALQGKTQLLLTGHTTFHRSWEEFWGMVEVGCWKVAPRGWPTPSPQVWKRAAGEVELLWLEGQPYWAPKGQFWTGDKAVIMDQAGVQVRPKDPRWPVLFAQLFYPSKSPAPDAPSCVRRTF